MVLARLSAMIVVCLASIAQTIQSTDSTITLVSAEGLANTALCHGRPPSILEKDARRMMFLSGHLRLRGGNEMTPEGQRLPVNGDSMSEDKNEGDESARYVPGMMQHEVFLAEDFASELGVSQA
jgi:hypothetical protein